MKQVLMMVSSDMRKPCVMMITNDIVWSKYYIIINDINKKLLNVKTNNVCMSKAMRNA